MKSCNSMLSLQSETCIITGAANGIGAAIARRFATTDAHLILLDIDGTKLQSLKKELSTPEKKLDTYVIDLASKVEIDRFWKSIQAEKVSILVNNAGIFPFIDFMKLTEEELTKVLNVNLHSCLWMCQHFIKNRISRGGGRIVNLGSIEAVLPFKKDLAHYGISKSAVIALTRDLAREYGSKKFNINCVLPGGILSDGVKKAAKKVITDMQINLLADGYKFKQRLPAGRFGKADEVARMVLVLCSELASYMHGAVVPVDGGFLSA